MTDGGSTMTGQHPGNQITSCKENPAPACVELPGALLMSSGANDPVVDPAIEFALPPEMPPQVIQLSLRAYLASGDDQMIRLYRNSREDLLFSETLTAMRHVDYAIVVDALPNDRFLVAISGDKAADKVALHLYVNTPADKTFPVSCQLALPFNPPMASSTPDLCSKHTFSATPAPVMLGDAPFMEQGSGALLALGGYLQRDGTGPGYTLDWSHDVTVQLWAQPTMLTTVPSYLFSDLDPDPGACGGVELWVYGTNGTPYINLTGCTNPQSAEVGGIMTAPRFPMDNGWHFVRVVRSAAGFDLCVDGLHTASLQVQAGAIVSHNPPTLGNQSSVSGSAHFVGGLDDVRVFTGALPCK